MSVDALFTVAPVSLPVNTEAELLAVYKQAAGIRTEKFYINNTNLPVFVKLRNNLGFKVEPADIHQRQFIIREVITVPYRYINEFRMLLSQEETSPFDYGDYEKIKEAFLRHPQPNRFVDMRIVIDATIMQDSLKASGTVYVANKDVILSICEDSTLVAHPFNSKSQILEHYEHVKDGRIGTSFFVEMIDNDAVVGDRFFYLAKKVYRIIPKKDHERLNGVYFCATNTVDGHTEVIHSSVYDFDEAEEQLGLCKTKDEAISAGDVKALRLEEITRLQHDKTILESTVQKEQLESKRAMDSLKAEMTRQENEHKIRIMDLEEENSRLKIAREQALVMTKEEIDEKKRLRDDYFTGKEHARKETLELLKFIPSVIAAGLAIYAITTNKRKAG